MEKPYTGRATIKESVNSFTIEIPAKKNWFVIIFLTGWLGGWLMGELFALGLVVGTTIGPFDHEAKGFASIFILFWLIAWTTGGFFAVRTWIWMISGKEIITFERNELRIAKKGALLHKPKSYDLKEVRNFSLNSTAHTNNFWWTTNRDIWNLGSNGIFKFDYGLKTIYFANGLDEAEGRHLLEKIMSKRLLKEENLPHPGHLQASAS